MKFGLTFLLIIVLLAACAEQQTPKSYDWQLRARFPVPQVPENNPMTAEKVELGRHLFYDTRLSFNEKQSCASCHQQQHAFAEPLLTSVGTTGEVHRRNSLALVNVAYNKTLTWAHDQLTTIERQVLIPMFGEQPIELGITGHETPILAKLVADERYQQLFNEAYPNRKVSFELISHALASFVRSLTSFNSRFDAYAYDMQDDALTDSELRGMALFFSEKLECHHCHGGFNFTQSTSHEKQPLDRRPFHNTGLYNVMVEFSYPSKDLGLYEVSLNPRDVGRFRAPTLRNIEKTAPYMHDGSISTLEQVVDFYSDGGRHIKQGEFAGDGRENPLKSQFVKGFELNAEEKQDLLNFMKSLTDDSFLTNKKHGNPWDTRK